MGSSWQLLSWRESQRAAPLARQVRPQLCGKQRARAPQRRGGVRVQAPPQRLRREQREGPSPSRGTRQPAQTPVPSHSAEGRRGGRSGAGARRSDEGRGMLAEVVGAHDPRRGNAPRRRRGSRYSEGHAGDTIRDFGLDARGQRSRWRAAQCTMCVRGVGECALKLPRAWEGCVVIRPRHHGLPTGLGKADRPG
jgi:hypothetical protein